jgi:hypothetical protein
MDWRSADLAQKYPGRYHVQDPHRDLSHLDATSVAVSLRCTRARVGGGAHRVTVLQVLVVDCRHSSEILRRILVLMASNPSPFLVIWEDGRLQSIDYELEYAMVSAYTIDSSEMVLIY